MIYPYISHYLILQNIQIVSTCVLIWKIKINNTKSFYTFIFTLITFYTVEENILWLFFFFYIFLSIQYNYNYKIFIYKYLG